MTHLGVRAASRSRAPHVARVWPPRWPTERRAMPVPAPAPRAIRADPDAEPFTPGEMQGIITRLAVIRGDRDALAYWARWWAGAVLPLKEGDR